MDSDRDFLLGRDLGKTGDYAICDRDGDRFPPAYNVSLRSMAVQALAMKRQFGKEYWILDARSTKILWSTVDKDAAPAAETAPRQDGNAGQIIGPAGAKGRMILKLAERKKGR